MTATPKRLRVVMITDGFPTAESPRLGVFNWRTARGLEGVVDLCVVHLRAWRPGRPVCEHGLQDGVSVVRLALPWIPRPVRWTGRRVLNVALGRRFGRAHVARLLQEADLVHSVGAAFAGVLGSAWGRRARTRHVAQIVGTDINVHMPVLRDQPGIVGWEHWLHGVATNSDELGRSFRRLYPRTQGMRTVYRGVDLRVFSPAGDVHGPQVGSGPVRFLYLGGFPVYPDCPYRDDTKGGVTLLAAWRAAERDLARSGATLVVAGPAVRERVELWRRHLFYPERVLAIGLLEPTDVPAYMRAADVVLIPSRQEGLPNVSVEAAACGRAVIGSAVGGLPEVVEHGQTGMLLPPGSEGELARALVEAARAPGLFRAMGSRARQRAEERFDSRAYPEQMLSLYREVLERPLAS